jgi:hypothetical protein
MTKFGQYISILIHFIDRNDAVKTKRMFEKYKIALTDPRESPLTSTVYTQVG